MGVINDIKDSFLETCVDMYEGNNFVKPFKAGKGYFLPVTDIKPGDFTPQQLEILKQSIKPGCINIINLGDLTKGYIDGDVKIEPVSKRDLLDKIFENDPELKEHVSDLSPDVTTSYGALNFLSSPAARKAGTVATAFGIIVLSAITAGCTDTPKDFSGKIGYVHYNQGKNLTNESDDFLRVKVYKDDEDSSSGDYDSTFSIYALKNDTGFNLTEWNETLEEGGYINGKAIEWDGEPYEITEVHRTRNKTETDKLVSEEKQEDYRENQFVKNLFKVLGVTAAGIAGTYVLMYMGDKTNDED
jgi:hypothetical protein